ncbi:hypothetical protein CTI14_14955, partial [Methylobacterium radiotolerans]
MPLSLARLLPPGRPQSPGDWVTVMRHRAESVEGQRLAPKDMQAFVGLQRQVSGVLAQSYRLDRRPAEARHTAFAEHAVILQR